MSARRLLGITTMVLLGCNGKSSEAPAAGSSSTPCTCTHTDDKQIVCVPNSVIAEHRRMREGQPPTMSLRELNRAFDQCAKP